MKNPKLRFKNDIDDWEEQLIANILQYEQPQKYIVNDDNYINSGIPVLTANKGFILGYTNENRVHSGECIIFDDFTMDSKYVNFDFMVKSSAMKILTCRENNNLKLLFEIFQKMKFESFGHSRHYISVIQPTNIKLPKLEIQSQIATILSDIDIKIKTQEQKVEKLKIFKSAMLDKMFPKEEQKIPEIRFDGFSGDWKEKELGEVCNINPSSKLPNIFEYVDLESVKGTQMLNHRTEIKGFAPSRAQRLAKKNDIFYQTVRPYQKNNFLFNLEENNYVFSTGYAQLRPFYDSMFLFCIIQRDSFVNKVLDNCTGTSYPCIAPNILKSILCLIPPTLEEQEKIGKYFEELDNKIELETSKLNKLKDIKNAILNKLLL